MRKLRHGWAGINPTVNGIKTKALWDTGAQVSIIPATTAKELLDHGAISIGLDCPMSLFGVGDGKLEATDRIVVELRLQDDVTRKLVAYVVPNCPYPLIVGLDFMVNEHIGVGHYGDHLKLFSLDESKGKPTIHDTRLDGMVIRPGLIEVMGAMVATKEPVENNQRWWNRQEQDDQDFLQELAGYQIVPGLTADEMIARLATIGIRPFQDDPAEPDAASTAFAASASDSPNTSSTQPNAERSTGRSSATTSSSTASTEGSPQPKIHVECADFPEFEDKLNELLNKHADVFANADEVGVSKGPPVTIRMLDDRPCSVKNYRCPLKLREELKALIESLVKAGVIERCEHSPYNSPCLLVPKKKEAGKDAGNRIVIDYRRLNKSVESVAFPMPRIQDILCTLAGCKVFSVMDIRHAYYTIELDPASRAMTAFSCEFGKWSFKFLPQGLKVAPAIFQDRINSDLSGIPNVTPYFDDIISAEATPELHLQQMDKVLTRLAEKGYKLKLSKCELLRKKVTFTGWQVTPEGVTITADKREHIDKLRPPNTVAEVRTLLGFTSFCRAHCPYYCDIVAPIQDLVHKGDRASQDVTQRWTGRHDKALAALKELLVSDEVLAYPDIEKPYELFTDASKYHMSAVLMQRDDAGNRLAIGYWSKGFKGSQLNWAALVKEARAVKEAVEHFEVFLAGAKTVLRCDHKPLASFLHQQTKNEMVNRWSLSIMRFDITFEWVATDVNISDCLSRLIRDDLYRPHEFVEEDFQVSSKQMSPSPPNNEAQRVAKPINETHQELLVHTVEQPDSFLSNMASTLECPELSAKLLALSLDDGDLQVLDGVDLSPAAFRTMQAKDAYVGRIRHQMATSRSDNGKFVDKDGILYRAYLGMKQGTEHLDSLALIIPKCLVMTVLCNTHLELAHVGRDRMVQTLQRRVYWKNMQRDIAEYVRGCEVCRLKTLKDPQCENLSRKPPSGPMRRLAVDLWSTKKHAAFTAMCLFSGYPFLVPIPDKTSKSAADALNEICAGSRTPDIILSDNGPEFIGSEFQRVLKERGIKHELTAPRSPQSNGILERFHGYLNTCLRISIGLSDTGDWQKSARAALEAYRKVPHTSTGETPLFLYSGQEPCYDIDHMLPTIPKNIWKQTDNVVDLEQLKVSQALARKNAVLARLKNKTPVKHPAPELHPGDRVYYKNMTGSKTESRWLPGYRIVRAVTSREFVVECTKTGIKMRVNKRHLRKTDPLAELVHNSNLDVVPGRSKLYLRADDLPDLHWPATEGAGELLPPTQEAMKEVVRDRRKDPAASPAPPVPSAKSGGGKPDRSRRSLIRPRKLDDYICVVFDHGECHAEEKRSAENDQSTTKRLRTTDRN